MGWGLVGHAWHPGGKGRCNPDSAPNCLPLMATLNLAQAVQSPQTSLGVEKGLRGPWAPPARAQLADPI